MRWMRWSVGIAGTKVNYILDADIASFFDTVSQEWLIRFVEHRIGDRRIIRLIQKWLKAGVLEDGVVTVSEKGTRAGFGDLTAACQRLPALRLRSLGGALATARGHGRHDHRALCRRYRRRLSSTRPTPGAFWDAMRERLEEFSLSLHPDKTRLIEFGRHAAATRKRRGLGKPETFNFLGFTFICGKSRAGQLPLKRKTRRDRMRAKLKEIKEELRRRMHQPIPEQGRWLGQVVTGFFAYHAVPTNSGH